MFTDCLLLTALPEFSILNAICNNANFPCLLRSAHDYYPASLSGLGEWHFPFTFARRDGTLPCLIAGWRFPSAKSAEVVQLRDTVSRKATSPRQAATVIICVLGRFRHAYRFLFSRLWNIDVLQIRIRVVDDWVLSRSF
jgi:hypothetical protein